MPGHPEQQHSGPPSEGLDFVRNLIDDMAIGLGLPLAIRHAECVPIVTEEDIGGMARVRQGQQSVVAGGGEALEFSYIVGGDAQGNALGEDAHVIAENSNACTGGAWVSQGGAVSEVVGGRWIEGPKEGEELPVFHISLA